MDVNEVPESPQKLPALPSTCQPLFPAVARRSSPDLMSSDENEEKEDDSRPLLLEAAPRSSPLLQPHQADQATQPAQAQPNTAKRLRPIRKNHICETCDRPFRLIHQLNRHVAAVHNKKFPFVCDVCFKGYSDNTHLRLHFKRHSPEELALRPALRLTFEQNSAMCAELSILRRDAARAQMTRCTDERCAVSVSRAASANNEPSFFRCFACQQPTHFGCAGYSPDMANDTTLLCIACVTAGGMKQEGCLLEHNSSCVLKTYIKENLNKRIIDIPADGACMPRSVLAALQPDNTSLPANADVCNFIRDVIRSSKSFCEEHPDVCGELLSASNTSLLHKLRTKWDSPFFDDFLFSAALFLKRDIHVYVCIANEVTCNVIPCKCAAEGGPLSLMRTGLYVRYDHYSALL